MPASTITRSFKDGRELTRKIRHPDGREVVYVTDYRGRQFVSLFSRTGRYEGTRRVDPGASMDPR